MVSSVRVTVGVSVGYYGADRLIAAARPIPSVSNESAENLL